MIDYEAVKKHFADKLAADFAGQGRFESAFYHTIKMVHDTAHEQTLAESASRIAALQSCYDTLLNNAADAHERIAALEVENAALKTAPGEPALYQCTNCGGANYGCTCGSMKDCTAPLYTSAPIIPMPTPARRK